MDEVYFIWQHENGRYTVASGGGHGLGASWACRSDLGCFNTATDAWFAVKDLS